MQRSCGAALYHTSTVQTSWPVHVWHCSAAVSRERLVYLWALFLRPFAGKNPVKPASGTQSAAVPAAGAECVSHHVRASGPLPQSQCRAVCHTLRRHARINGVANYFYSGACACERGGWYPASPSVPRSPGQVSTSNHRLPNIERPSSESPPSWSVPAQAPEAVCPPHRPLSLSAAGSLRSPVRCPAKATGLPTAPDRLRGQPADKLPALGGWETPGRGNASRASKTSTTSPAPPSRPGYSQPPRSPKKPTPRPQC